MFPTLQQAIADLLALHFDDGTTANGLLNIPAVTAFREHYRALWTRSGMAGLIARMGTG